MRPPRFSKGGFQKRKNSCAHLWCAATPFKRSSLKICASSGEGRVAAMAEPRSLQIQCNTTELGRCSTLATQLLRRQWRRFVLHTLDPRFVSILRTPPPLPLPRRPRAFAVKTLSGRPGGVRDAARGGVLERQPSTTPAERPIKDHGTRLTRTKDARRRN